MKRKITGFVTSVAAIVLAFGMTVNAASFDPTYYAAQNPDVVAVFGTDANALYQHYLTNGKAEGRLAYAGAKKGEDVSAPTTKNPTVVSANNAGVTLDKLMQAVTQDQYKWLNSFYVDASGIPTIVGYTDYNEALQNIDTYSQLAGIEATNIYDILVKNGTKPQYVKYLFQNKTTRENYYYVIADASKVYLYSADGALAATHTR